MDILNQLCYGSALIFVGAILIVVVTTLAIAIYGCFTKKIEGKLIAKISVAVMFACTCPWLVKLLTAIWKRMVM